ncbi:MAG: hypothetical protein VB095_00795 [Anaerovorax sp.]|nr:hypothetical protein [Anaerovorax sp.]
MKKFFILIMCIAIFFSFSGFSDSAHFGPHKTGSPLVHAYKNMPKEAYLPTFPIKVNGITIDNQKSKYPFLVYQNTTYLPLTYQLNQIMGVKLYIYETMEKRPDNLYRVYVGREEIGSNTYKPLLIKGSNSKKIKVKQLTMPLQLNHIGYDNDDFKIGINPPPFIYQNIIYLPLTPKIITDEFGWEYSWDASKGLEINTHDPVRPIIFNPRGIDQMQPVNYIENNPYDYACEGNVYVGVKNKSVSNYENNLVVIKEKGKPLRSIKLEGFCGIWYAYIRQVDKELVEKGMVYPSIKNNEFTFIGAEIKSDDPFIKNEDLYLITVDITNDQISYKKLH